MKGTLVYKDQHGTVWGIQPTFDGLEIRAYLLVDQTEDGFTEESIEQVIAEIDRGPEWVHEQPAVPVQKEQLDTGAFPNEPLS